MHIVHQCGVRSTVRAGNTCPGTLRQQQTGTSCIHKYRPLPLFSTHWPKRETVMSRDFFFFFYNFFWPKKKKTKCASLIMLLSQRKQAGNKSSNRNALASLSVPERLYIELGMEPVACCSISPNPIIPRRLMSGWTHPQGRVASYLSVVGVSWGCVRRRRWVGFDAPALHVWNKLVWDFCQDVFGQPCHT